MKLIYRVLVCTLLTAIMQMRAHGQGCPVGQFGAGCRLDCHCALSQHCSVHGQCPNNGPCRSPYFGPGCQHVDLVTTQGSCEIPIYIRDNNDSSCNPDAKATSVRLKFNKHVFIFWFRIRANNHIALFHRYFTTTVRTFVNPQVQLFPVDNTALDVRLIPEYHTVDLTISGLVAPHICTISVSGGRNVALRQSVNQTSNFLGDPLNKVRAENAVDGRTSQDSCSRTHFQHLLPELYLKFDAPKWVHTILIFNTNVNRNWLFKFSLRIWDTDGSPRTAYYDDSVNPLPVYEIYTPTDYLISALTIVASACFQEENNVLSMCEVQVIGDVACPLDKYGVECENSCHCNRSVICFTITGKCQHTPVYYCPPGSHGERCEFPCPDNCRYNACHAHSGVCHLCIPGYLGEFCDQVCAPGTFGTNCSLECSVYCADICHHVTGVCSCEEGHTGSMCSECAAGWYGDNCTHKCSDFCYQNICDALTGDCETCIDNHAGYFCEDCDTGWFGDNCTKTCPRICPSHLCDNITGDCISCVGNRTGPKCEDCPAGYYGTMCDIRCSGFCRNRSCDEVGGACHACIDNYHGDYCNLEMEDIYPPVWLFPLLVPVVLLFLVCFMVGGGDYSSEEY